MFCPSVEVATMGFLTPNRSFMNGPKSRTLPDYLRTFIGIYRFCGSGPPKNKKPLVGTHAIASVSKSSGVHPSTVNSGVLNHQSTLSSDQISLGHTRYDSPTAYGIHGYPTVNRWLTLS